ncbi:MAG TPA: PQQ-binding-like beta-propeller repeat protein [Acidimicrobiales bacterium]|nr:PQQ-binding-like beta-propeller repeat protein [Acidimicrobiales bacterium]
MRRYRRLPVTLLLASLLPLGAAAGCAGTGSGRPAARPTPATSPTPTSPTPTGPASPTGPSPGTGPSPSPAAGAAAWTTYQDSAAHLGDAGADPALDPLRPAWKATLDGTAVYGQPLLFRGKVIVATEADNVYALDAATGRVDWQVSLGQPLRGVAAAAGCGDVDPLGVTSTPVVDAATGTVYVVGEVSTAGRPPVHHQLVGIDVATGRTVLSVDADPPLPAGQDRLHLLQRAALALGNGRVYIGYGGQYGDCGDYSGWVVGVAVPGPPGAPPAAGPAQAAFDVTPGGTGGAVWDGGSGPAIGPHGTVYVTTGNPDRPGPAPWTEAVLELGAGLGGRPLAAFQDRAAHGDLDLSTGGPVLLPGGLLFVVGKTDVGFVLSRSGLAPVAAIAGVCGSDPDGGPAFDGRTGSIYVPCRAGGIQQVNLTGRRLGWRAGRANSTPVLAGGDLWALRYPDGILEELDPVSGRVLQSLPVGRRVPTFASLSVAAGLVLVPTVSGVEAFQGPAGPGTS